MKPTSWILSLLLGACTIAAGDPDITVRKLSESSYELTIAVANEVSVARAQGLLFPTAQSICGSRSVQYNHYAFNAHATLDDSAHGKDSRLVLTQEIACGAPDVERAANHVSYDWAPAASDDAMVEKMTYQYFRERDSGDLAAAYGRFSDGLKEASRFESWSKSVNEFNAMAGAVDFRKVQKISWVKDPPGVDPGFYAAVDYTSRFANVPFHCGYVAWYRSERGSLTIAREEDNFIDRASEAKMQSAQIQAILKSFGCVGLTQTAGALPESETATIEYPSVEAALKALHKKPGVTFRTENGWTIADEDAISTIWSFAPKGHPAYPTAVKRAVVVVDGVTNIKMDVLCGADKVACDNVVIQFQRINERIGGAIRKDRN